MAGRITAAAGGAILLSTLASLAAPGPVELATVRGALSQLSVPFVPNAGQWDREAAFAAHTFAGTLFVTTEGILVYRLNGKPIAGAEATSPPGTRDRSSERAAARQPGWVLTETLVDASHNSLPATPSGSMPQKGKVSYAIGNDERRHRDGIASFERVNLGDVYPGINVQLRATGSNIEKIFTVAPRRDPGRIRMQVGGAQRLELGPRGELIAQTGNGPVTYTAPIAYQEDDAGQRTTVPVRYALGHQALSYGFAVDAYDAGRPLVIDPLLQSTYLGGGNSDFANALAIHPATGEVYVTGFTASADFPKVAGAEQTGHAGLTFDAFVTRLDPGLTTRLQSTYLGGNGDDKAYALAIHPASGEVYVAGSTTSGNFPKTTGAEQPGKNASMDAFVTRLDAALTTRLQSTYLGGNNNEDIRALVIHPFTGEVYVAGPTHSSDFPKVAGSEQTTHASPGGQDAFITRLSAALTAILQSTYLGGNGNDIVRSLAIHPATGEIYATGITGSTNFPKTAGAEQPAHAVDGDGYDAFVTRLNAALTTRLQSTYLGGDGTDDAYALAIHPATGEAYVAGYTNSTNFPKVTGAEQITPGGGDDTFVTRLDAALITRVQSTYLGGGGDDYPVALAIHPATREIYVAGYTGSTDFPNVAGAAQAAHAADGGNDDAFATRLSAALTARLQSTYLGGAGRDAANAMVIHPVTGALYLAGSTSSTDLPQAAGAEQASSGGGTDAFVSLATLDLRAGGAVPGVFSFAPRTGVPAGSLQVSAPATISGLADSPQNIAILGGNLAQYCISSGATCDCDVTPFGSAMASIANGQSICVRQYAPAIVPSSATTTILVGGGSATFFVSTAPSCSLDIDGNTAIDALTDGLMLLRAMFGLTGTAVTNAAVGDGASRTTWSQIQPYLNGNCGTGFAL
ncbi:MAG: hypothetical protein IPM02_17775 [Betaproteobacteria bacterium]|nr:hypothetical protein [Betaproteobacteria bacterium]